MKLYQTKDVAAAEKYALLLKYCSDFESLYWSRSIDLPQNVQKAVITVRDYFQVEIEEVLKGFSLVCDLSDNLEQKLMGLFKENETLRKILGSGIIKAGEQANAVLPILQADEAFHPICETISSGTTIIIA